MFFSGYRPLFVLDHFRQNAKKTTPSTESQEYMPWDVSVSGLAINPEMKNVPRKIVRNLVPYNPAPTEAEADIIEAARKKQLEQFQKDRQLQFGLGDGVKVINFELKGDLSTDSNGLPQGTEFSVFVDGELSTNPEILRSLNKFKEIISDPDSFTEVLTPYIKESPASDSYGRVVYCTSVKRKRKLKMNKHKLRKRRKLQRSLKRKLKR